MSTKLLCCWFVAVDPVRPGTLGAAAAGRVVEGVVVGAGDVVCAAAENAITVLKTLTMK